MNGELKLCKDDVSMTPMESLYGVVDVGSGNVFGSFLLRKNLAEATRDEMIRMYVSEGVPEERLNIQVLNVHEMLRGGFKVGNV